MYADINIKDMKKVELPIFALKSRPVLDGVIVRRMRKKTRSF